MWSRSELKTRAKAAFKANYWRCVLVSVLLTLLIGGGAGSSVRKKDQSSEQASDRQASSVMAVLDDTGLDEIVEKLDKAGLTKKVTIAIGGLGLVGIALSLMVFNPLIVGCRRFFLKNSRGGAELNELGTGFKENWGNVILVMFLRTLFLALWSLLFVIPGLIKAYSYRLVPYILKEHPEFTGTQAITLSRKMMNGHKWDTFVLDLSFLGWILLSALTLGILSLFYVSPYINATDAELYEAIRSGYEAQNA